MTFEELNLLGAFVVTPEPFEDQRGIFYRVFCKNDFKSIGHSEDFVQVNYSLSRKTGTVRGMHYQHPPKSEVKMVKCIRGAIIDVIIDLRYGSETFLRWEKVELTEKNRKMIYIPQGFAHGFQTKEPNCELLYFHTEFYNPDYEDAVNYMDPKVNIEWPLEVTEISKKDRNQDFLSDDFNGLKL